MCSSSAIERSPRDIRQKVRPAAVRLCPAILVGVAMLISSAPPGRAGETTATPVAVAPPAPDADRPAPANPAPGQPARATEPQFFGAVGFGWA